MPRYVLKQVDESAAAKAREFIAENWFRLLIGVCLIAIVVHSYVAPHSRGCEVRIDFDKDLSR
jgi:hypothetical protein